MKIAFMETPSPWLIRQNSQVSLGLLYLATILKNGGYDVRYLRPESPEELMGFDIVCMGGTTVEYPMNEDCAKWLKENSPETKIFIGGPHATAMCDEIEKTGLFDSICAGEGESLILDMVEDAENGKLKKVYQNGYIKNLDLIPFPDRSLIKGSHGGDIFAYGQNYAGEGNENVITSRGCPYDCAFCAWKSMWNGTMRYRSIDNVIKEIEGIIESSEIRQIRFSDDLMTWNRKRCLEMCDRLESLDIAWRASVRADSLTPEICEALVQAGCKEISPGIESGDQRVLDFLNKKTTTEKMQEGCRNAMKAGITVRALFMIGTPGEHPDTPEINRNYMEELDFDMITLSTFIPFPGSPIWDDPEVYYCTVLSDDFRKYNKDYWVMTNEGKAKRKYEPLIHNKILTLDEQVDNVARMERYIEETGKYNQG